MAKEDGAEPIRLTFGEVEGRLARLHEIASDKRTQFQARLRNFQKHGIPAGAVASRGKAIRYSPGQVLELALALEFTQLGLLPERVVKVFEGDRFPIFMATRMAAQAILSKGGFLPDKDRVDENLPTTTGRWWQTHDEEDDPLSMFLYFDPFGLEALTDITAKYEDPVTATFFYGGAGIIRENIVRWTAGPNVRRLALVNVTALIWSLIVRTKPENQRAFLDELVAWCDAQEDAHFIDTVQEAIDEGVEETAKVVVIETYEDVVAYADELMNLKGLPRPVAEALVKRAQQMIEEGKVPAEGTSLAGKPWREMTEQDTEDEIVAQMTLGGMPEMVARAHIEAGREERHERMRERLREKLAKEGRSWPQPDDLGERTGKRFGDMSVFEMVMELGGFDSGASKADDQEGSAANGDR